MDTKRDLPVIETTTISTIALQEASRFPNKKRKMTTEVKLDRKLAHLVKKMINPNDTSPPNPDYIVTILRTQHKEYQRKDASELRQNVENCVAYLLTQQLKASSDGTPQSQANSSPASSRKRRAEERREEAFEAAALQEEATRQSAGVGGGLNAALLNRYRKQQEVEQQLNSDAAPAPKDKASSGPPSTTSTKVKKRKRVPKSPAMLAAGGSSFGGGEEEPPPFLTPVPRPVERYTDLGGMDQTIQELRQLIEYPLVRPELYRHLGIDPPRGVLLRGPPGTGKSHLANAVAGELNVQYFKVSAPELVSGMSGESESRIRELFKTASDQAPSLIFLDEIDAVAPKRNEAGGSRGMEKRMVAQLLTSMDSITPDQNRDGAAVIVLAATNRPDSLDSALRRAGRFDREILLGVPDEEAREKILRAMTKEMRLSGDFDYKILAKKTPGFVGADVRSLSKEAAVLAINRIFCNVLVDQIGAEEVKDPEKQNANDRPAPLTSEQMEPLFVTMGDFLDAIPMVQPSSKREGFATVPGVTWDDIGALQSIREELTISVLEPIRNPEKFKALGLTLPAGVLLYGPPGCGKTLLAKAIASESGANFISVKGPELLDKYVGESERAVRLVFERARASSPCVVFFDELDSLVPKRGMDSSGSGVSERVVNQLLTEMDGLESRRSVFVIAATNRPELIDPAMMRPGRLDKLLYVPLPTPEDRVSILKALAAGVRIGSDVDLTAIGSSDHAIGYSGADCSALLREAGLAVIKEDSSTHAEATEDLCIQKRHFDKAFKAVLPSVSVRDQKKYDRIRQRMASARTRAVVEDNNDGDVDGFEIPVADKDGQGKSTGETSVQERTNGEPKQSKEEKNQDSLVDEKMEGADENNGKNPAIVGKNDGEDISSQDQLSDQKNDGDSRETLVQPE